MEMYLISFPRMLIKSPVCWTLAGKTCLLTFDMGNEVVSERGVRAGVTVGGAGAASAQVG